MWWDDLLGACCWSGIFDALFITPWGWLCLGAVATLAGLYIAFVEKQLELGLGIAAAGVIVMLLSARAIGNTRA